eukprot:7570203-Pyramimonas_sp.AAC.2
MPPQSGQTEGSGRNSDVPCSLVGPACGSVRGKIPSRASWDNRTFLSGLPQLASRRPRRQWNPRRKRGAPP